jgi:hypothetical protein
MPTASHDASCASDVAAIGADRLQSAGWLVAPAAIPDGLRATLAVQLGPALARREAIRARNGVEGNNDGTLHHLLADHPAFVELLACYEAFDPLLRAFFSGNYILNSYGGVVNVRDASAYVHRVHRDIRFASDARRFMLNTLVMLDDFTVENGATYLLSGSHLSASKPEDAHFFRAAERAIGAAGSVLIFDSRLWHAAGPNLTDRPRRALTLTFTSPFFKQQLDYPRLMGDAKGESFTPFLRQAIGYNARVPATLDDYYVPVARRFYQRGQDE